MKWISVEDELPPLDLAVLVRRSRDNWGRTHTVANGEERTIWRWVAAVRREIKPWANNPVPYEWDEFGPGVIFGQDVSHWCAISDPCENNDAAIREAEMGRLSAGIRAMFSKEEQAERDGEIDG